MTGWGARALPRGWARLRADVLLRDGWACQTSEADAISVCGEYAYEVDHVVPRSQGGSDERDNLRAICPAHHRAKSLAESGAVTDRRARPTEAHPGEVQA